MAVVSVTEQPEASSDWNELWQRTYDRQLLVECDSRADTEVTVRTATTTVLVSGVPTVVPWLPRIGYTFAHLLGATIDSGAFLQTVRYRRTRAAANPEGSTWLLDLHYGPFNTSFFGQYPLAWPTKISFQGQKFERVVLFDVNNAPIANSAGSPFEEPVTVDDTRSIITVVRNEACKTVTVNGVTYNAFDLTLASNYRDTLNTAPWNGFPAKCVKCTSITTSDPQYDTNGEVWYVEVTYVFEVNRDTWQKKILDQGYQFLDGSGKAVPVVNDGQQVDDPVLLDGSGHVLASGGTPVYRTFDVYPDLDWTVLDIDFTQALGQT